MTPWAFRDRGEKSTMTETLIEIERRAIREAIERNRGNKRKAALELGISRTSLWRKLRKAKDVEYAQKTV